MISIPSHAIQIPVQPELTAEHVKTPSQLNGSCMKYHLEMPAAMLVCKTMHWRSLSKWQGCTKSTSITCVHNAVARNSLTYLTALDTPDRSETDKRIKEEMKAHSQRQKSIMQEKAKVTNRKTDLQIAKCLTLSSSPETRDQRAEEVVQQSGRLCFCSCHHVWYCKINCRPEPWMAKWQHLE